MESLKTTPAREHVEEIRRTKFSIGGEPNPLTEDLHQAVKNLSAELYAKDVHFMMELIQNAEDNEYPEGVDPSLEFVITSKDITNTGAPATLLVFNNEKGFSSKNIESICSVGRSTKKGLRKRGYIGEKGIGFKSVFLITAQPYIFSKGYQIRFNEKPCQHCNVGYIVPEWVEDDPTLSAIQSVYGSSTALPTTTLVLPLKPDKVKPVKNQLSCVHPEVLLFLSKIKRLSVREDNEDPRLNTVSAISISSEKNFVTSKSMDADSYTLHLTADDIGDVVDRECGYYMWKQRFPVKEESKVDVRMEVEEWVITLAFPNGKRLNRGASLPGIYSFLPTETVTNFPFIIQADFLLASSRENILWDSKWNQGILDCVHVAFLNAFTSLVKSTENAPVSSLSNMFRFLPIQESSHPKLNHVRDAIKAKLMNEAIIPCESYTAQKLFRKPMEVSRLKAEFWSILKKARSQGVSLDNISSHGAFILASSFDKVEYNEILRFLEITAVGYEWYAKCIAGSNLVMGVSEDFYLQLLLFIAEHWSSFHNTNIKNIPIIKYVRLDGIVDVFKINAVSLVSNTNKLLAADSDYISWLINWNTIFRGSTGQFFLPKVTREAMRSFSKEHTLVKWLKEEVKIKFVSVREYAEHLSSSVGNDRKLAVSYAHFLYTSQEKKYLSSYEVQTLCSNMPIVDNYGQVIVGKSGVLVPANGSNWVQLIGSNPWRQQNFVELGEDYVRSVSYFGISASGEKLLSFLETYVGASDVPNLSPPDAAIPTMSSPLTKSNTFLLLNWLHNFNLRGRLNLPERFLSSIKNGCWLKISLSGCPGHRPPSESFMLDSSIGRLLQNGSVLVDIPILDESFYGGQIKEFKEELRMIGVKLHEKDACEFIGKRLMSIAASSKLTRENVLSILKFICYLQYNFLPCADFIKSIRGEKWLRTVCGDMTPNNSVLSSYEWNAASQLSDIPFIDHDYYGKEIFDYKEELKQLGVVVSFGQNYQLVIDNLRSPASLNSWSSEVFLFSLKCLQNARSLDKLVQVLKNKKCLKTNLGYRCPSECFFLNQESEWGCLLQVFGSFAILDKNFYGRSIFSMVNELKKIGVMMDLEDASKEFTRTFKQQASLHSIGKQNALLFLAAFRQLKTMKVKLPSELKSCIQQEKWIRTRLGDYRSPKDCILFGTDWESISHISLLPFIDDSNSFYGSGIHDYRKELEQLGVTTDFEDGAKFVAAGLYLPMDSSSITTESVYSLLDSVKKLKENEVDIPLKFLEKLSQKNWLKTNFGYRRPNECLLFFSDWDSFLKRIDGPFVDEDFYGPRITSYKEELRFLGVITDVGMGCQLLASCLNSHSNFETISRIYSYLSEFKWESSDEESRKIWIPRGTNNGVWVMPQDCVIYDKSNLFGKQLEVLEKSKYDKRILGFFACTLGVKVHPSVDDYCKLWKTWESEGRSITNAECCAFWQFVVRNQNSVSEETFKKNLSKLPVLDPASDGIILLKKQDVFIGDDLFLTDLFRSSSRPMFVWYPLLSAKMFSRTKLVDVYSKLGVRTLSETVQKNISEVDMVGFKQVNPRENIIKKGMIKLILGFLAQPHVKLEVERRHDAVSRVLSVEVFETSEPMKVGYSLSFSCGAVVEVEANRMIRWEKQDSKFFMHKMERCCGHKNMIEYACHFAEVIADGVLWENEELVPQLSELIRFGFLVEFDEEAVEFLMKMKSLEIFAEDQQFLSSKFSSSE